MSSVQAPVYRTLGHRLGTLAFACLVAPLAACSGVAPGNAGNLGGQAGAASASGGSPDSGGAAAGGASSGGAAGAAGAAAGGDAGASAGGAAGASAGGSSGASAGGAAGAAAGGGGSGGGSTAPSFGAPEELATGVNLPHDIAVDATHLYWVEIGTFTPSYQANGRVVRRPKAGGTTQVLASGRYWPAQIHVDASAVYFSDEGSYWDPSKPGRLARVAKSGGSVKELASDSVIYGFASDASNLYFFNPNQVKKIPKAGGTKTTLAGALDAVNDIAVDPSGVYFTTSTQDGLPVSQGMGSVNRVGAGGGALTLLAEAKAAGGVAVDDSHVFFGSKGSVFRLPKAGGSAVSLAKSSSVWEIEIDQTHAYWTDCQGGSVLAVPLAGGTPVTLASGYVCPSGLAVDADHVYFTDRGNLNGTVTHDHAGRIVRIKK